MDKGLRRNAVLLRVSNRLVKNKEDPAAGLISVLLTVPWMIAA
jgi:hypothetical protein